MKHRLVISNGLGMNTKVWLNNQGDFSAKVQFGDAALNYLGVDGVDFQIEEDRVSIGIEPTYQYEKLKIITIHKDKSKSTITDGIAWGAYGSNVVFKTRSFQDFKYRSKFVRFVEEWHPKLFPT